MNLLASVPALNLFLSGNSQTNVVVFLIIPELVDFVLFGEAVVNSGFMFEYTPNEVVDDSGVKTSLPSVKKDVCVVGI